MLPYARLSTLSPICYAFRILQIRLLLVMSGGRKQEGLMHVLWQCTNPGGITETYCDIAPHSLWSCSTCRCNTIRPCFIWFPILQQRFLMSAKPGHINSIHYRLKCHLPFPIWLLPLVLQLKITLKEPCQQWGLHKSQPWSPDSLHTSLTFFKCVGFSVRQTTIESNRAEKGLP